MGEASTENKEHNLFKYDKVSMGILVSNFNHGIARKSVVPWHMALFFSVKVGRKSSQNEPLWQILDIGNVFGPSFGLKNSQYLQCKE